MAWCLVKHGDNFTIPMHISGWVRHKGRKVEVNEFYNYLPRQGSVTISDHISSAAN